MRSVRGAAADSDGAPRYFPIYGDGPILSSYEAKSSTADETGPSRWAEDANGAQRPAGAFARRR